MNTQPLTIRSWPKAILHIDADAFFASCEQAVHPELRGKPVITGKDGAFAFRGKGFRDLEVNLEVRHKEYALALHRDSFQGVEPGQQLSVGEVRIVTGGTLSGSITSCVVFARKRRPSSRRPKTICRRTTCAMSTAA